MTNVTKTNEEDTKTNKEMTNVTKTNEEDTNILQHKNNVPFAYSPLGMFLGFFTTGPIVCKNVQQKRPHGRGITVKFQFGARRKSRDDHMP